MFTTIRKRLDYGHTKIYLGLFLLALLAYWQLAFFAFGMTWDNVDVVLPWRTFVAESIQHGFFPFWNPYQDGGYPIYGDMRSVFNPEFWFMAATFGYSVTAIHVLQLLAVFFGGVGMYHLSYFFTKSKRASFLAGAMFMMSGFMVQQAQDLPRIIAACWLPFALLSAYKLQAFPSLKTALTFCLFFFLMFSGGYLPISLIFIYVAIPLFLWFVVQRLRLNQKQELKKQVLFNGVFIVVTLILLAPFLVTFLDMKEHVERLGGVSLYWAQFGNLPVKDLLSFILPFSAVKESPEYTDISMRSVYSGMFVLIIIATSLIYKPNRKKLLLFLGAVFFLIISFGGEGFLHKYAYEYLPLLNLFRFPSYYSLFTIVIVLLLFAMAMKSLIDFIPRKRLLSVIILFFAGILGLTLFANNASFECPFALLKVPIKPALTTMETSAWQHVFVQGMIQSVLLLGSIVVILVFWRNEKKIIGILSFFIVIEGFLATQLQLPYTGLQNESPTAMQMNVNKQPSTFLLPDLNRSIREQTKEKVMNAPFWRNTNIFSKTFSNEGFNSFQLQTNKDFPEKQPGLYEYSARQPVAYLASSVKRYDSTKVLTIDTNTPEKQVFLHGEVDEKYIKTADFDTAATISPSSFSPNNFSFIINSKKPALLVVQQTYFPHWKAFSHENELEIIKVNFKYMGVLVPEGINEVTFSFSNNTVKYAFYISLLGFIVLIAILIIISTSSRKKAQKRMLIYTLFLVGVGTSYLIKKHSIISQTSLEYFKIKTEGAEASLKVVNTDLPLSSDFSATDLWGRFTYLSPDMIQDDIFTALDKNNTVDVYDFREAKAERLHSLILRKYNPVQQKSYRFLQKTRFENDPKFKPLKGFFKKKLFFSSAKTKDVELGPSTSFKNNFVRVDSNELYSRSEHIYAKNLQRNKYYNIYLSGFIKAKENKPIHFVVEHKREDNILQALYFKLTQPLAGNLFLSHFQTIKKVRENDEFKLYLWNPDKGNFLLSEGMISFIPIEK